MNKNEIDSHSLDLNRIVAPILCIWVTFGSLCILCNCLIVFVIVKWKPLHTNCQYLLVNLAISNALYGLCLVAQGCRGLIMNSKHIAATETQMNCLIIVFPPHFSSTVSHWLTLAISFDRFLAVFKPIFYKNLSKSYSIAMNVSCWSYGLLQSCLIFYTYSETELEPVCHSNTGTISSFYNIMNGIFGVIVCVLVVLLYVGTVITIKLKMRKVRKKPPTKNDLEVNIVKTLAVVVGFYIACWLTTTVGTIVAMSTLPENQLDVVGAIFRAVTALDATSNFLIYLTMSKAFRVGFYATVLKNSNIIAPLTVSSS